MGQRLGHHFVGDGCWSVVRSVVSCLFAGMLYFKMQYVSQAVVDVLMVIVHWEYGQGILNNICVRGL